MVTIRTCTPMREVRHRNSTEEGAEQYWGAGSGGAGGKADGQGKFWKTVCDLHAEAGGSIDLF